MNASSNSRHFVMAGIIALAIVILFVLGLEIYWRSKGNLVSFNDDKVLWAHERRKVYQPADRSTVFAGSSRIKWDIDIETWENLTGEKAVQLALVGTSPRKILEDLANDENFKGKLIVDVMEFVFFTFDTMRFERSSREALEYYYNETPAQRGSALLGFALESKLVMIDEGKFGLNQLLLEVSQNNNRPGVRAAPIPFQPEYIIVTARRQNKFTPVFLNNPGLIEKHVEHWKRDMMGGGPPEIPKGKALDSLCQVYKTLIDKIESRGGTVLFIRPPASGDYLASEIHFFPRQQYWDYFIEYCKVPGIHFADYPATANFVCTEGSHLNPDDAVKYTASLVNTLRTEYEWSFPVSKSGISKN